MYCNCGDSGGGSGGGGKTKTNGWNTLHTGCTCTMLWDLTSWAVVPVRLRAAPMYTWPATSVMCSSNCQLFSPGGKKEKGVIVQHWSTYCVSYWSHYCISVCLKKKKIITYSYMYIFLSILVCIHACLKNKFFITYPYIYISLSILLCVHVRLKKKIITYPYIYINFTVFMYV